MSAQHTQEPVAWQSTKDKQFVTADKKKAKMWECSGYVLTPLYAFPPDAAARIAELEKQRDTLLAALRYLTEAILTNADADYMKRQMDEAIRVLDLHGVSMPVPYKAIASTKGGAS